MPSSRSSSTTPFELVGRDPHGERGARRLGVGAGVSVRLSTRPPACSAMSAASLGRRDRVVDGHRHPAGRDDAAVGLGCVASDSALSAASPSVAPPSAGIGPMSRAGAPGSTTPGSTVDGSLAAHRAAGEQECGECCGRCRGCEVVSCAHCIAGAERDVWTSAGSPVTIGLRFAVNRRAAPTFRARGAFSVRMPRRLSRRRGRAPCAHRSRASAMQRGRRRRARSRTRRGSRRSARARTPSG